MLVNNLYVKTAIHCYSQSPVICSHHQAGLSQPVKKSDRCAPVHGQYFHSYRRKEEEYSKFSGHSWRHNNMSNQFSRLKSDQNNIPHCHVQNQKFTIWFDCSGKISNARHLSSKYCYTLWYPSHGKPAAMFVSPTQMNLNKVQLPLIFERAIPPLLLCTPVYVTGLYQLNFILIWAWRFNTTVLIQQCTNSRG